MTDELLRVEALSIVGETDAGAVPVVQELALAVGAGETVGLVGESGSGKTVLARAILGLVDPPLRRTAGRIVFGGQDLATFDEEGLRRLRGRDIALTTPEPRKHLNPLMTVGAQIANVVMAHSDASRARAMERTVELLRDVGIPDPALRVAAYPHELSGGMCQRVIIAMALAHRTRLLIADEPTAGLDVTISRQILDQIDELVRQHGTSLLLVSRDLGVVAHYCRRIAVMYAGRIVEVAEVEAFFDGPAHPYSRQLLRAATAARDAARGAARATRLLPPAPSGCAYASRCPIVEDACRAAVPELSAAAPDRLARCRRSAALLAGEIAA
ncbi:ABC transporter ATP-binding protein [Stella sp.]|uniref:ABC transporter ATP-binding protein n=1 Tax=Stella sp. TaxID=2912054 RepID=UPI0035AFC424